MPALLELLRALPGPPEGIRRAISLTDGQAEPFVAQVAMHGLSAVVRSALAGAGVDLPPQASARLDRDALSVAMWVARHRALAARSLEALAARGVVPVVLKGYGLASRIYPAPEERTASDLDLLLSAEELPKAEEAMASLGLTPMARPEEQYAREHHHSINFEGPGQLVELHHRALMAVGNVLDAAPLLSRAKEGTLDGRQVRWLAPEDEVGYLAAHAASHAFARLSWLYDLKLYASRVQLDWAAVVRRASGAGIRGPAYFGFAVAARAMGAAIPAETLESLRPSQWQARVATRLFDDARLEAGYFWTHRFAGYAATPLLASDVGAMARYVGHHLWRGTRRKLAVRFPELLPARWRG